MLLVIDKASNKPVYLQIAEQIRAGCVEGELKANTKLPSVRTLGRDLGISFHTVNKAYALLRDEGFIVMGERASPRVSSSLPQPSLELLEEAYAEFLRISLGAGFSEEFVRNWLEAKTKQGGDHV